MLRAEDCLVTVGKKNTYTEKRRKACIAVMRCVTAYVCAYTLLSGVPVAPLFACAGALSSVSRVTHLRARLDTRLLRGTVLIGSLA